MAGWHGWLAGRWAGTWAGSLAARLHGCTAARLHGGRVGGRARWLVGGAGGFAGWLAGWLAGWRAGWLAGWLAAGSMPARQCRLVDQPALTSRSSRPACRRCRLVDAGSSMQRAGIDEPASTSRRARTCRQRPASARSHMVPRDKVPGPEAQAGGQWACVRGCVGKGDQGGLFGFFAGLRLCVLSTGTCTNAIR